MSMLPYSTALIIGAGSGLSASLARLLAGNGLKVGLAARNVQKLAALAAETGAQTFAVDASDPGQVERLFQAADRAIGEPDVVIYNASGRLRGAIGELDPAAVGNAIAVSAFGGFLAAQQAARRMLKHQHGALLLTGATASIKGFAQSTPFAMGKFALRGLAQCMARELGPQGIHVAHFVIDGSIRNPGRVEPPDRPDSLLDPDAIAQTYLDIMRQPKSAWTWEVELRPWLERF